jgi:hypothetical protein
MIRTTFDIFYRFLPGLFLFLAVIPMDAGEPVVDSWVRLSGAKYARIYKTWAAATNGISSATWTNTEIAVPPSKSNGTQAQPVYGGILSIRVSANYVYITSSALPTYVMGPWYLNAARTQPFPNWPMNQDMLTRIARTPPGPVVSKTSTSLGAIALWVDGGIIHNQLDAFYYNGSYDTNAVSVFTQSWQRNAQFAEGATWDPTGSHQPFTGERHHHISPTALRYQLGDHITYSPTNLTYTENPAQTNHSPILGWAFDGYPIYGPYGYSYPTNMNSTVRRMVSGYVPRDGNFGTTNLNVTGRTSYPQWALAIGKPNAVNGPNVSTSYPLGWYVQDFDHLADLGYTQTTNATVGDFDLDRYNGRFCRTPEFPNGTYAYFVAIESNGVPRFPYIIGLQYYGQRTSGDYGAPATLNFTSVETPNTTNFLGGPNATAVVSNPQKSGNTLTLTWSSVEGGHYNVEISTNLTTWSAAKTNLVAAGNSASTNLNATAANQFFRVARTFLDNYDPVITP